jgi:hypothetical protein
MLWPNPRQVQLRVWIEPTSKAADATAATQTDLARVTVELSDPRNGATLSTKTLAAASVDEAATRVAGYVARQIFSMDPATPVWCFGASDGGDLSALLLSRQQRVRVETPDDVLGARCEQITRLKSVALSSRCAGVVRYELAQLYSIQGEPHEDLLTALRLHAVNREQYPRFYRGRYRLCMTLEMIANPGFRFTDVKAARDEVAEILNILHRCRLTERRLCADAEIRPAADGGAGCELTPALRLELLKAAQLELRGVRRQLTVPAVLWAALVHRHERAIWRIYYSGLRVRQSFHDGVCVAELLVAARRRITERRLEQEQKAEKPSEEWQKERKQEKRFRPLTPRHLKPAIFVASAIAGNDDLLADIPEKSHGRKSRDPWPPAHSLDRPAPQYDRDRLRWRPRLRCTISWQAAYNTACLYAVLASERLATEKILSPAERLAWEERVVVSLERVVNNQYAEMERPFDLVSQDPDFSALTAAPEEFPAFKKFLDDLRRMDYPDFDVSQALWGRAD